MIDRLSVDREPAGTIWHDASALGRSDLGAEVGLGALAEDA